MRVLAWRSWWRVPCSLPACRPHGPCPQTDWDWSCAAPRWPRPSPGTGSHLQREAPIDGWAQERCKSSALAISCTNLSRWHSLVGQSMGVSPSYWYRIPIINLRLSDDCLSFIMGIPISIRWHLFSEQSPWPHFYQTGSAPSMDQVLIRVNLCSL